MSPKRQILFFGNYFKVFFDPLDRKLKAKIDDVLFLVQIAERIPSKFFKHLQGTNGLYEIRIEYRSNIYRVFCCFDDGNLVVLFNGFQKKKQKTPRKEVDKALRIMTEYFEYKKNNNGN